MSKKIKSRKVKFKLVRKLKAYRFLIAGCVAVIMSGVFMLVAMTYDERDTARLTAQVEMITDDVQSLFTDETYSMLAEGVTLEQVDQIYEDMEKLEGKSHFTYDTAADLNYAIQNAKHAEQMIELRDMVSALFNEDGVLKVDANVDDVVAKADDVANFAPAYVASLQPQIDNAVSQQSEMIVK